MGPGSRADRSKVQLGFRQYKFETGHQEVSHATHAQKGNCIHFLRADMKDVPAAMLIIGSKGRFVGIGSLGSAMSVMTPCTSAAPKCTEFLYCNFLDLIISSLPFSLMHANFIETSSNEEIMLIIRE